MTYDHENYKRRIPGEGEWEKINEEIPSDKMVIFRLLVDNYGLEETLKHTYIVPMHGRLLC